MGKWKREGLVLVLGNGKRDGLLGLNRGRGERKEDDFWKRRDH